MKIGNWEQNGWKNSAHTADQSEVCFSYMQERTEWERDQIDRRNNSETGATTTHGDMNNNQQKSYGRKWAEERRMKKEPQG